MSDKLYLFADNNNATAENLGSYRLYNMKIEGDLEGVKADEINYVDYLESDGASYIDLPGDTITYNDDFKIEVQCNRIPLCHVVGTSSNYGQTQTQLLHEGSTNFLQAHMYGTRVCYTAYTNLASGTGVETFVLSPTSVYVNNTMLVSIETVGTARPTNNDFRIFGRGGSWDTQISKAGLRIYYVKLWNGNTLLYHLRPCVDTEGVPCMYDEVSKQYFYNQGSGTFGYKKELRDFQPVLDSNGVPCLMDKINKKYYYDKNGKGFKHNGYTRVGYLEGVANRYINTNIIPTMNTRVEVDISLTSYFIYAHVFGSDTFMQFQYQTTNAWLYISKKGVTHSIGDGATRFEKCKIIMDMTDTTNLATINGTNWGNNTGTTTSTGCPIVLFSGYDQWGEVSLNEMGQIRIHSFKIYESNELIFDGIPVLDNEGTPCMYDLVTETFFYGERGDGEFSYGAVEELECPKADYVEYLEAPETPPSPADCRFDTGIPFDNTYSKIELKIDRNANHNYGILINTSNEHYSSSSFSLRWNYGVMFAVGKANGTGTGNVQIEDYGGALSKATEIILTYTPYKWTYNGVDYPMTTDILDNSTGNIMLFYSDIHYTRLISWKVWDKDNNLIQHLQPCLDNNGISCLYDIVNDNFIYSGYTYETGKSIGYNPIKYIETNGTQYIDTGIVPTDNTDIDMVARAVAKEYTPVEYLQGDGASYIDTGIPITIGYDIECNYRYGTPTMTGIIFGLSDKNNQGNSAHPKLRIGYIPPSPSDFNYDNNCFASQFNSEATEKGGMFTDCTFSNTLYNYFLFGANALNGDPGVPCHMCDCFISMFKIWDAEGNLVQHLISVLDSEGTPCMYDLVTEQFHYNQGTGTFSYGNVTPSKNYLMNDFYIESTYNFKETNTNVEPNLTASAGATLTLGSTYSAYLTETEIEQAVDNGWTIQ